MSTLGTWLRQAWQSLGAEWIKPQRADSPPHSGFEVLDFQIFSFLKELWVPDPVPRQAVLTRGEGDTPPRAAHRPHCHLSVCTSLASWDGCEKEGGGYGGMGSAQDPALMSRVFIGSPQCEEGVLRGTQNPQDSSYPLGACSSVRAGRWGK